MLRRKGQRAKRGSGRGSEEGSRFWRASAVSYLLADSKLLFTKSLNGLMCSSFVNKT